MEQNPLDKEARHVATSGELRPPLFCSDKHRPSTALLYGTPSKHFSSCVLLSYAHYPGRVGFKDSIVRKPLRLPSASPAPHQASGVQDANRSSRDSG